VGLGEFRCPWCGRVQVYDLEQAGSFFCCRDCGRRSQLPVLSRSSEDPPVPPASPAAPGSLLPAPGSSRAAPGKSPASGSARPEPAAPPASLSGPEEPAAIRRRQRACLRQEQEEEEDSSPLPLMPAEPPPPQRQPHGPRQILQEARQELQAEHLRQRTWARVRQGLGLLVGSKLIETMLVVIVLLAFASRWLQGPFHTLQPLLPKDLLGGCGLLWLGSEVLTLAGYYYFFRAPLELGLREWSLAALGIGWLRWLLCLGGSLLCLLTGEEDAGFLAQALFLVGLFLLVQWSVHLILLHRLGARLRSYWLQQQVGQVGVLLLASLLGWWWLASLYPLPFWHPADPHLAPNNIFLEFWLGCAGLLLLLVLAGALCWHLRLLYNFWLVLHN
jgi:hypothetical protein